MMKENGRYMKLGVVGISVVVIGLSVLASCSREAPHHTAVNFHEYREEMPDFSVLKNTSDRKAAFVNYLLPKVRSMNKEIQLKRNYLDSLYQKSRADEDLTKREKAWVTETARKYKVPEPDLDDAATWRELMRRVDTIPVAMILAQAAVESAWGTSRFAREGNNLFGKRCYTKGCGIVPRQRLDGQHYEVQAYDTVKQSIRNYIYNLNSNRAYKRLREMRETARQENQLLTGDALAASLLHYSEIGDNYVQIVRSVIHHNDFAQYDEL